MIRAVTTEPAYLRILDRSTGALTDAIERYARAFLGQRDRSPALRRLAEVIGKNSFLADLLGRESTARVARAVLASRRRYEDRPVIVVPNVTFTEAVDEIVSRTPEVAPFAHPEAVRKIVADGGFTLARASEPKIVEAIQRAIARAVESGYTVNDTAQIIAQLGDWSRAYSETVYRVNISRAFSSGRMEQVKQEGVREAIPAFRFSAVDDDATTEYCRPLDGFVAPVDYYEWKRIKPPLHFNCRSGLDFIDRYEYEDMKKSGVLDASGVYKPSGFSKGGPMPGFVTGGR